VHGGLNEEEEEPSCPADGLMRIIMTTAAVTTGSVRVDSGGGGGGGRGGGRGERGREGGGGEGIDDIGYLAHYGSNPVGLEVCPWLITVSSGQRVHLTLTNLRRTAVQVPLSRGGGGRGGGGGGKGGGGAADGGRLSKVYGQLDHIELSCLASVCINDVTSGREVNIDACANTGNSRRVVTSYRHIFTSSGNIVRIYLTGHDVTATEEPILLIQYTGKSYLNTQGYGCVREVARYSNSIYGTRRCSNRTNVCLWLKIADIC